ncbi:DUF3558 family protein [Dactylosporangium sp. NPDC051541]|uniref:DUF3558 family protein n=1 Tax=Dactylosporangium sp. NPDC051541 TaxID=3363977 RepID=UPI0037888C69
MNVRSGITLAAGLAAGALALAACGDSPAPAPPGGSTTTTAAAPPPAPATTAAAGGAIKDACVLVSLEEAAAASGLSGLSKQESSAAFCSYQKGTQAVDVSVARAPYTKASVDAAKAGLDSPATDLPGVGDAAFVAKEQAGVGFGDTWARGYSIEIRVKSTAKDPVAAAGVLLRTAVGHIPNS